jgi:phenylacetate-CoA ligase
MRPLLALMLAYSLRGWRLLLEIDRRSMVLLFLPGMERVRWKIGQLKAYAVFRTARRRVPAYAKFVGASRPRFRRGLVPDLTALPVMDKENYVKVYALGERCLGGRLPDRDVVIDESSGSSGIPTNWARGGAERRANQRMLEFGFRHLLGPGPYFVINSFALGPWATGVNLTMAFARSTVLKSLGPDADKVINTLRLFGTEPQYIIMGYPPFLKVLVDSGALDWSAYNITMLYGGEGMSELLRDYLLGQGIRRIYGSLGASDLELNIGSENDFTIALRRRLATDPALAARLVQHGGAMPVVIQFNPADFHIESTPAGELLFTLCRPMHLSPKLRYNLHDRGHVVRFPELRRALAESGLRPEDLSPHFTDLPLLFHYGRADMAVAFFGCKISPPDVQEALLRLPVLIPRVRSFALVTFEDEAANKNLRICLELTTGHTLADLDEAELEATFFQELRSLNQDFRESWRMVPADRPPRLAFYPQGTGPFAQNDLRIKLRYIQEE